MARVIGGLKVKPNMSDQTLQYLAPRYVIAWSNKAQYRLRGISESLCKFAHPDAPGNPKSRCLQLNAYCSVLLRNHGHTSPWNHS